MNAAIAAGQRHILIVEDEKDMCLILDVLLESKSQNYPR